MSALTEAQWQQQVLDLATFHGWLPYHTLRSVGSHKGWPDLVLCKPPRLLFVELKSDTGIVTADQCAWLVRLTECGEEAAVWRPADLDEVARALGWRQTRIQQYVCRKHEEHL